MEDQSNQATEEPQTDAKAVEEHQEHQTTEEKTGDEKDDIKESPEGELESETKPELENETKPITDKKEGAEEVQEIVSSSSKDLAQPTKPRRLIKSRSKGSRSYSFQNYGLTYLPYMSNFEPSEEARRRADEFLKALKL